MKTYGFCGSIIVNVFDETAEINVDSTYKGIEEIDSVTFISHFNGGTEVDFLNWGSPGFLNLKEKGHYFFSNFNFRNSIYFKCNNIKLDSCYFSAPLVDFKSPYVDITNSELKWANVLIDSSLIINFKNNRQTDGSTEIINSVEFNADSLMLFGKYYLEVRAHKTILKNSRDSIYNLSPSDPSGVLLLDHIYDLSNQ
jgi:hypothetical protein